ncbi:hypothetical protein P879_04536 [Paragonimus westermani]|uniref:28S ribosomal protein S22 n=1 Tax=Paragonimus westermani TaxID=34504 RepID=A0A8T0D5N5_9TREM|nr:hypothetical protein P879_04536 [Paragonimus westermani]
MSSSIFFSLGNSIANCYLMRQHYSSQVCTRLHDLFADPRIHNLLRLITYNNPTVVHKPRFKKLLRNNIQMLSDKELKTIQQLSLTFTNQRLQMPPVLAERVETTVGGGIVSRDPKLQGLLPGNYKLVFTDISPDRNARDRLIIVREPDGVLRHATTSERNRMNTIYFPLPGRQLRIPMMFQGRYLQDMLDRGQYLYVLDRACNQFEPDDPQYLRVCHSVYEHINQRAWTPIHSEDQELPANPLRALRHTRHYGPLALYLIANLNSCGGLVYEALSCQHYARLGWLLRLIVLLKPSSPFAVSLKESQLNLPPPDEIDVSTLMSKQSDLSLTSEDTQNILSYTQLFIDREPMGDSHKRLLTQHVEACREGLAVHNEQATG